MTLVHEEIISGIILILIGLGFLISNLYGLDFLSTLFTYWPVILIIIGIIILMKDKGGFCCRRKMN